MAQMKFSSHLMAQLLTVADNPTDAQAAVKEVKGTLKSYFAQVDDEALKAQQSVEVNRVARDRNFNREFKGRETSPAAIIASKQNGAAVRHDFRAADTEVNKLRQGMDKAVTPELVDALVAKATQFPEVDLIKQRPAAFGTVEHMALQTNSSFIRSEAYESLGAIFTRLPARATPEIWQKLHEASGKEEIINLSSKDNERVLKQVQTLNALPPRPGSVAETTVQVFKAAFA